MNPLLPIEYLVLLGVAFMLGVVYCSWRSSAKADGRKRALLIGLRFLASLCLLALAFNPGYWKAENVDSEAVWGFLLDRSTSMSIKDVDGPERWSRVGEIVSETAKIADVSGDLKFYPFADRLERETKVEDFASLKPDGESTNIIKSGMDLLNKYQVGVETLKGIIVLSDGRNVGTEDPNYFTLQAAASGAPIYPVLIGGEVPRRDLVLKVKRRYYITFPGQNLSICYDLANRNMGNLKVDMSLSPVNGGEPLTRAMAVADGADATGKFVLKFDKPGQYEYSLTVPPVAGESDVENNRVKLLCNVLESKIKVLMVEGRPYWDSKFLAQSLRRDPNIELSTVYRLATDRFFAVAEEASDSHDSEQVIFPDSLEELSKYDVIVVGKGCEYFLNEARIDLIKEYLRNNGGVLLFARGKPYSGEFPEISELEPVIWGAGLNREFHWRPTLAGERSGLFSEMLPDRKASIWSELPALKNASRCPELKTFSETLVEGVFDGDTRGATFPALIYRNFGKGVVLAVNSNGLWQWDFFPSSDRAEKFYKEFWIQIIHWLLRYSEFLPGQNFAVHLDKEVVEPGTAVVAQINCRQAPEKSELKLKIKSGEKIIEECVPSQSREKGLTWHGVFTLRKPGLYQVVLDVKSEKGTSSTRTMLRVKEPPSENDDWSADPAFLAKLAEASGGRMLVPKDLKELLAGNQNQIEDLSMLPGNAVWIPYWSKWWCLCLILVFLGTECYLRRRSGML